VDEMMYIVDPQDMRICFEAYMNTIKDGMKTLNEEVYCHHCGKIFPVRIPIMVKKSDIEAFEILMDTARKYLGDRGVNQMILQDMFQEITAALKKRYESKKPQLIVLQGGNSGHSD
jgi:uncharacterized protein YbaR (Trm112 family)